MDNFLDRTIELTINNYREAKIELRNDGDLINHLASLIFTHKNTNIPFNKVKLIRKHIKANTSRISPFRGELLYILSLLIAKDENIEEIIENMYLNFEVLKDNGFKDCEYLALTSYVLAKYNKDKNSNNVVYRMKEVFNLLKRKYKNITNEDDYLISALWALNDIDIGTIEEFIDNVFNEIMDINIKSKNSIQGLTNSIILKGSSGNMYKTLELMLKIEQNNIKIAPQFLPLLGVLTNKDIRNSANLIKEVTSKLKEEESEYEYYIDKGFRTIIALSIISFSCDKEEREYVDELLALGTFSFIKSKNKGVIYEALA